MIRFNSSPAHIGFFFDSAADLVYKNPPLKCSTAAFAARLPFFWYSSSSLRKALTAGCHNRHYSLRSLRNHVLMILKIIHTYIHQFIFSVHHTDRTPVPFLPVSMLSGCHTSYFLPGNIKPQMPLLPQRNREALFFS